MARRLYNYMILPDQIRALFKEYNAFTYEVVDSYVFLCDVCNDDGCVKKTEFICVKIRKRGEQTIYCNNSDLQVFFAKFILNQSFILNGKNDIYSKEKLI
jgi:hypothetical protein